MPKKRMKRPVMRDDIPPFFPEGSRVSAKFKGAFCEAKIQKIVVKLIKLEVTLKNSPTETRTITDSDVPKAKYEVNEEVELIIDNVPVKYVIKSVKDESIYHVEFNDGDEKLVPRKDIIPEPDSYWDPRVI